MKITINDIHNTRTQITQSVSSQYIEYMANIRLDSELNPFLHIIPFCNKKGFHKKYSLKKFLFLKL
jgi:hypothetical protein